jgi:hypothetical protein
VIVRVLAYDEWPRVSGHLALLLPLRTDEDCKVLVVESSEGEILGQWALLGYPHVEGIEIAPQCQRHAAVARNLLEGMKALCRAQGVTWVFTGAASPQVAALLDKLGAIPVPTPVYQWELGEDHASRSVHSGDHRGGRRGGEHRHRQEEEQAAEGDGAAAAGPDAESSAAGHPAPARP